MLYPKEFSDLLESLSILPGVGQKTATRYIYAIDSSDEETVKKLAEDLLNFKKNIKKCNICGHLTNNEICSICADKNRNKKILCVVEDSKSVFMFEEAGNYKGMYHVLGNLISPVDGINPEDLSIKSLLERIKSNEIEEVIIALKPSIEGETTSLYIQKLLENSNVKISRLSYGIPAGSDFEYLDSLTLIKAIEDRKTIS